LSTYILQQQITSTQARPRTVSGNEAVNPPNRTLYNVDTIFEQDFGSPPQSSSTWTKIYQEPTSIGSKLAHKRDFPSRRSIPAQPQSIKENSEWAEFHYQIRVCGNNEARIEAIKTALQNHPQHTVLANSTDGSNLSPLHLSAQRGNIELARILLDFSANINAKDSRSNSVLDFAVRYNNENFVSFLVDQGVDETGISNWNRGRFEEMKDMIELRKREANKTDIVRTKFAFGKYPENMPANLFDQALDGIPKTNKNISITDNDTETVLSTSVKQLSTKLPARVIRFTKEQCDILEAHFQTQNKPSTSTKKGFADTLNVPVDKINVSD